MFLKDVDCNACGQRRENVDVGTGGWEAGDLDCPRCGQPTPHTSVCNGGRNSRYRFCDWSGATGHVKWLGADAPEGMQPRAESEDGVVQKTTTGREIRGSKDQTEAVRDRVDWNRRNDRSFQIAKGG